jgi:CheY-like chemotaxis protein
MDEATLARAVEPFFSTKGVGKGTGLGLSMVHGLAAQSGGQLVLWSRPGQGTRAEVWLPVADELALPQPTVMAEPQRARRPARILLVDDEELVRQGTAEMLLGLGYDVVEAAGGAAAVGMVRAGLAPDLLVTDYLMPGLNGVALAAALRALRPGLPALMITGYAHLHDDEAGHLPRLAKPFREADLAVRVAELIEQGDRVVRLAERTATSRGRHN